jgi:hypothetical protein
MYQGATVLTRMPSAAHSTEGEVYDCIGVVSVYMQCNYVYNSDTPTC